MGEEFAGVVKEPAAVVNAHAIRSEPDEIALIKRPAHPFRKRGIDIPLAEQVFEIPCGKPAGVDIEHVADKRGNGIVQSSAPKFIVTFGKCGADVPQTVLKAFPCVHAASFPGVSFDGVTVPFDQHHGDEHPQGKHIQKVKHRLVRQDGFGGFER